MANASVFLKMCIRDRYNAGNIYSVDYALKRLGVEATITSDKEVLMLSLIHIYPYRMNNNAGNETGKWNMAAGDIREFLLVWDGSSGYYAYLLNIRE